MSRILYIEPNSGIAGDMFTAALSELFDNLDFLYESLASLPISSEFKINFSNIQKKGITATRFCVELNCHEHHIDHHHHQHHHGRTLQDIVSIIEAGNKIKPEAKALAINIFRKLAEAEAKVHGALTDHVHFHEVGAIDAIVDITAAAILINELNIDEVISAPISVGQGTIISAHGIIPVPSPATTELIKGKPVNYTSVKAELTTPTGAAILATIVDKWNIPYTGTLNMSGYGAGTKEFDNMANVLRVSLVIDQKENSVGFENEVTVLECNIDDYSPEHLTYIGPKLITLEALDYSIVPATVKKCRQGMLLKVICYPQNKDKIINFLLKETTTLGVRYRNEKRIILERSFLKLNTVYGEITAKLAKNNLGEIIKLKLEQGEIEKIAEKENKSYFEVYKYLDSIAQQWLNKLKDKETE